MVRLVIWRYDPEASDERGTLRLRRILSSETEAKEVWKPFCNCLAFIGRLETLKGTLIEELLD